MKRKRCALPNLSARLHPLPLPHALWAQDSRVPLGAGTGRSHCTGTRAPQSFSSCTTQTRASIKFTELDSGVAMKHLKVDNGVANGDIAMEILTNIGA